MTPELAEIIGLFVADGSLQENHISFWGNINEDKAYYDSILKPLFFNTFSININPHEKESNRVYGFYICSRKIINYFKSLGFKPGSKTYTVHIPPKIMKSSEKIKCAFLRGYADGDGSLTFGKKHGTCQEILKIIHTRPRIELISVSQELIIDICTILDELTISYSKFQVNSKKENIHTAYRIQITKK